MTQTNDLINNPFAQAWINFDFKVATKLQCDRIIQDLFETSDSLPMSFNSRQEAQEHLNISYRALFERVERAKARSKAHLVAAGCKEFENIPVIIEKSELKKYDNVFEPYMINKIVSKCKKYVVIELPAAAAIIFNLTSRSNRSRIKQQLGGFTDKGELIVGIDLASELQEICFYHDTLHYPVSVPVKTNVLLAYLDLSHQSMFIVSESCSMISKLNDMVERLNQKAHHGRHYTYVALKNTHINYLKSRDSKTDKSDATILFIAGSTPSNLIPKSLISDEYCATGKIISSILKAKNQRYQSVITEIKNAVLELTGTAIDKNANGDEVCRAATLLLLSLMPKLRYCVQRALSDSDPKHNEELIAAVRGLRLLDDEQINRALQMRSICNDEDVTPDLQVRFIDNGSSADEIKAGKITYKGFEGLNLDYCKDIVTDGVLTHLTPAPGYSYEEMDAIMFYTMASSLIGSIQEAVMLQMQIETQKCAIKDLVVPSNIAMTAACQIPAIGRYQAFELVITLGDVWRFASAKDAKSYLGIVPVQSSTGHKNCKGRRQSRKGRKSFKKSMFLGQLAESMRHDFGISDDCSLWKNICHAVAVYIAMMKQNKQYMPLKKDAEGRNKSKLRQFSKVKVDDRSDIIASIRKSRRVSKQGMTAMLCGLYTITRVKEAHNSCQDEPLMVADFENDTAIMPTYQNNYKLPKVDSRYERHLIKERISHALFNDYNCFYATVDSICPGRGSLMGWFGNNYFAFLDLLINDISAHSYAFANTVKHAGAQEILKIVQRKVNTFGKKAKSTLNSIKKAEQYQAATEITLQSL